MGARSEVLCVCVLPHHGCKVAGNDSGNSTPTHTKLPSEDVSVKFEVCSEFVSAAGKDLVSLINICIYFIRSILYVRDSQKGFDLFIGSPLRTVYEYT